MDMLQKINQLYPDRVKQNEPLARFTTFKIGGPAELFFEAVTTQELVDSTALARKFQMPVFILGGGTNILIGDRGIQGLVVKNMTMDIRFKGIKQNKIGNTQESIVYIEADSGVPINKLVRYTVDEGLAGLEMQLGLPGNVGGAVYMNSKWTHPEGYVGDVVYQATILTPKGEIKTVPRDYFQFAYDFSTLQKSGDIVLSVVFALKKDDKEKLWNTANQSIAYRRSTQPQGVMSAGCTFKNITKAQAMVLNTPNHTTSAGFLVDNAGVKGLMVGGAQISGQHANFIINVAKATAADVVALINIAKQKVKEKFNVALEEEMIRVGQF